MGSFYRFANKGRGGLRRNGVQAKWQHARPLGSLQLIRIAEKLPLCTLPTPSDAKDPQVHLALWGDRQSDFSKVFPYFTKGCCWAPLALTRPEASDQLASWMIWLRLRGSSTFKLHLVYPFCMQIPRLTKLFPSRTVTTSHISVLCNLSLVLWCVCG